MNGKGACRLGVAAMLSVGVQGCDPDARVGEKIHYKLIVEYSDARGRHNQSGIFAVKPVQPYSSGYGLWTGGWGGIHCQVRGSAIPIPADGGTIVVPVQINSRYERETSGHECLVLLDSFDLWKDWPNRDDGWLMGWNGLARSRGTAELAEKDPLDLFFIPQGGSLADRVPVVDNEAAGIRIGRVTIEITDAPVTPTPGVIADIESRSADKRRWCPPVPPYSPCPTLIGKYN